MDITPDPGSIEAVAASIIDTPLEESEVSLADENEENTTADEPELEASEADDEEDETDADVAADEQYDDQEEVEEAQEEPAPSMYTVKVDGRTQQVTLDELTRGYSGQTYIQQGMDQLASAKKQMQDEYGSMQQERQFLTDLRQKAENGQALTAPKPPSKALFEQDPIGYMSEKIAYDENLTEYQQQSQFISQMEQRQVAEEKQRHDKYLESQIEVLHQRIPQLADPEKAPAYRDKMVQAGVNYYGFDPQEIMGQSDGRYVAALHDAMQWRQMLEAKGQVRQKAENIRAVVKPGVKRNERTANARKAKDTAAQMRRTGKDSDVAAWLLT